MNTLILIHDELHKYRAGEMYKSGSDIFQNFALSDIQRPIPPLPDRKADGADAFSIGERKSELKSSSLLKSGRGGPNAASGAPNEEKRLSTLFRRLEEGKREEEEASPATETLEWGAKPFAEEAGNRDELLGEKKEPDGAGPREPDGAGPKKEGAM